MKWISIRRGLWSSSTQNRDLEGDQTVMLHRHERRVYLFGHWTPFVVVTTAQLPREV